MAFSAVVSLLDTQTQTLVQAQWDRLENQCGLNGIRITPYPHISWQVAASHEPDALDAALTQQAQASFPFSIQTAGLGIFSGPEPILYLAVVKTRPLMDFQHAIWDLAEPYGMRINPNYHPESWIPHITLAYHDINPANIGCMLQNFAFTKYDWSIRLDNLAHVTQAGDEVGELIRRYKFNLAGGKQ
jgi:2'-5' RNA ligase